MELCVQIRPEFARNVGKSVLAKAVEASRFNPPLKILLKVLRNHGILSVKVGKNAEEPAVGEIAPQTFRRVRISEGFERVVDYRRVFGKTIERFFYWGKRIEMFLLCPVEPI